MKPHKSGISYQEAKEVGAKFVSNFFLLLISVAVMLGVLLKFHPKFSSSDAPPTKPIAAPVQREHAAHKAPAAAPLEDQGAATKVAEATTGTKPASAGDPEELLQEAIRLIDSGDHVAAKVILEKLVLEHPNDDAALTELAMIHLIDLKNPAEAAKYLERAIRANPNSKVAISELVGIYEDSDNVAAGMEVLQKLYDENPGNTNMALGMGQMLASHEQYQKAIPYLEAAAESGNTDVITELADVYSETGQTDLAVENYRKVIKTEQDNFDPDAATEEKGINEEKLSSAYSNLVAELFAQNKFEEAEAAIKEARSFVGNDQVVTSMLRQLEGKKL